MQKDRDDFSASVKDVLAKRVGCHCCNPGCLKLTSGSHEDPTKAVNIGVAAHITAAAPGGKRYDPKLSSEERKAIKNGIWLCQNCGKLIDSDEQKYSVELLIKWKRDAEQQAGVEVANSTPQPFGYSSSRFEEYLKKLVGTPQSWWLDEINPSTWYEFELFTAVQKKFEDPEEKPKDVPKPILKAICDTDKQSILIIGEPGAGKSTLLKKLALEAARIALRDCAAPIPVLVKLKDYEASGENPGIRGLIQSALESYDPSLDAEAMNQLLQNQKIRLLIDGWNELSDEKAKSKIKDFCKPHSVIVTSRNVRDYREIQEKFEIQPLSRTAVEHFFAQRLPNTQLAKLQELVDRVSDFGQTPLMVWMLFSIFCDDGSIPETRGETYRTFTKAYAKRAKAGIDLDNARKFLGKLAFEMMKSPTPTDPRAFRLKVTEVEAEEIFGSEAELDRMLNHLLKQQGKLGNREISFCHQSLQEYYAAEHLRQELVQHPEWLQKQTGTQYSWFQYYYLNYTKWTESVAIMLGLPEINQDLAEQLVKSALDVDLMLGSQLAGEVKLEFQTDTISTVVRQKVPEWLKIFLLGETRSPKAVDELIKTMKQHLDATTRVRVVWASRHLSGKSIMPLISEAIKDDDPHIREVALRTIAESDIEQAVELVAQILPKEPVTSVREAAVVTVLGKSTSEASILALLSATQDAELNVYGMAAHILKEMDRATLLSVLVKILKNKDIELAIRQSAAHQLGDLGDKSTLRDLFEAQLDLNLNIHEEAADAWVRIRSKLIRKDTDVQNDEEKERENQINHWRKYLKSEEPTLRGNAVFHLAQLLDKENAVHLVNQALDDPNHYVRGHAITRLIELIGREALSEAIRALDDSHHEVRNQASQALLSIKDPPLRDVEIPPETIDNLVDALNQSQEPYELIKVTKILVNLCHIVPCQLLHASLENAFIDVSHNVDDRLRYIATQGLGMFASQRSGDRLLKILEEDNDDMVVLGAVESLKKMPCEITKIYLSKLALLISTLEKSLITDALLSIQNRCQFYNYEIWQAHLTTQKADRQTHPNSDPNAITIKTLESLTIMTDKAPIFNQQHATIGVNYAAEGSKVEFAQHTSSSEQTFEILLTDYQQFIQQLQQKYLTLADATTIPQIIEVEAKLIEAQDQQRWQNFLNLKRLWHGSKKAGFKIGEHFAENNVWAKGAIAFLEGLSEDVK